MGLEYRREDTAILLVDPHNDMFAEGGKVWPRLKDVGDKNNVHRNIKAIIGFARQSNILIVYVPHRRWREGDVENWKHPSRAHVALKGLKLYEYGAWGGDWYKEFEPQKGDLICYEHWGMGGFQNTDLDLLLRQHDIRKVIIIGMTAPGCVESTGRQAMELGYSVTLVSDATAAFNDSLMKSAHELNGPLFSDAIVKTEELLQNIKW
jgi:nicotinamidase-related amidase